MDSEQTAIDLKDRTAALRAVEALLRMLRHAIDTFGGDDLETVTVFLTVAAGSLAPGYRHRPPCEPAVTEPMSAFRYRPISGRAVAASCGLPRETVRRRLEKLEEEGRIERVTGGYQIIHDPLRDQRSRDFTVGLVRELELAAGRLHEDG